MLAGPYNTEYSVAMDSGLATQVGCCRLGQIEIPISGKPEIGAAPRNDEEKSCNPSIW
jgi:hypothetical protein